jgi:hypothetical protein
VKSVGQEITPAALAFPSAADFQFANVADFYQAKTRNPKTFSYFFWILGIKKNPQRASTAGRGLLEYNSINLKN